MNSYYIYIHIYLTHTHTHPPDLYKRCTGAPAYISLTLRAGQVQVLNLPTTQETVRRMPAQHYTAIYTLPMAEAIVVSS